MYDRADRKIKVSKLSLLFVRDKHFLDDQWLLSKLVVDGCKIGHISFDLFSSIDDDFFFRNVFIHPNLPVKRFCLNHSILCDP